MMDSDPDRDVDPPSDKTAERGVRFHAGLKLWHHERCQLDPSIQRHPVHWFGIVSAGEPSVGLYSAKTWPVLHACWS